jgi:hypothetical protein
MIQTHNLKRLALVKPQSITTNAISGTVDTLGFNYAEIVVHLDTQAASSTVAFAVTEGDTTSAATTAADLAMTTVAPQTSTQDFYVWHLDLKKRKRFLKLAITPVTAVLGSAHLVLSRGGQTPATAAARGETGAVFA